MRLSPLSLLLFLAVLIAPPGNAQAPAGAPQPAKDEIALARENLRAVEAAHPGNTLEVAAALDKLLNAQLDAMKASDETLDLAKREMAVAEAAGGARSKAFVDALIVTSGAYAALSNPSEGRSFAERALEVAQKEFPDSVEFTSAADSLATACSALGDYSCALHADEAGIAVERKGGPAREWELAQTLASRSDMKDRTHDTAGAGADIEEALSIAARVRPNDPNLGIFESNAGTHYSRAQEFSKAISHFNRAFDLLGRSYGADSPMLQVITGNLADLYCRTGQFALSWKSYEVAIDNKSEPVESLAWDHWAYARSLASGGDLEHAISEGLIAAKMGRENFVLQARTLPERQALAYSRHRPLGLDAALSVLARHPALPPEKIFQEMVRSRALVADEMARREKDLNANGDPEVARLLKEMNQARADLLAVEQAEPDKHGNSEAIIQATGRMEKIERAMAQRSASIRNDERATAVEVGDLRHGLPAHSVLVSYVVYRRIAVEMVDAARTLTPAYMAFVLYPGSDRIRLFDLGEAKPIDELVTRARATADAEAHAGGLGSIRNERAYRDAAEALRKRIWDPLRPELHGAKLALVVPDGMLNLIPFAAFPEGNGYMVEHGPVVHMLTSERDLVAAEGASKKTGLLAVGSPAFDLAASSVPASTVRGGNISCDAFRNLEFNPLPGTAAEVNDLGASWRHWNQGEPASLFTGAEATRSRFLAEAERNRVLHVATHAFFLDRSCGNGNPLLHSGLVFAGANQGRDASILTAQQIASLDLSGVDWAVLSACNTGNGVLLDGEGVLGLQRAFREAGARSVVMTLWPVDDEVARRFMHELYAQRLGLHASTADAVWNASRKLLLDRHAAQKSTHPWYWAGFVGSGGWE